MKEYYCQFNGRKVGSIGSFGNFSVKLKAESVADANDKIYQTHEHITGFSAIEVQKKSARMTITFTTREDLQWAEKMISLARIRSAEDSGTPLHGAQASILLCALGRSTKTKIH